MTPLEYVPATQITFSLSNSGSFIDKSMGLLSLCPSALLLTSWSPEFFLYTDDPFIFSFLIYFL